VGPDDPHADAAGYPVLTDGVVTLRVLELADAGAHLALEDDAFVRWFGGAPSTLDGVRSWIAEVRERWSRNDPRRNFGIWDAPGDQLLGNIELNPDPRLDGIGPLEANLAYALGPAARGRGIATRAVQLACSYVASIGVERAVIRAEPANPASHRVAERAGFERAGEVHGSDGTLLWRWVRPLPG